MRCFQALVVFLACSFAAGCGGYGFPGGGSGSSGPAGTVEDFARFLSEGDCEEARSLIVPEQRQYFTDECVEDSRRLQRMGGFIQVEILLEEIEGNEARVEARMVTGGGRARTENVQLVLIDGAWLIKD